MRDGLSLLDQAIAARPTGAIGEAQVRDMLGLADRGRVLDLFEAVMRGDAAGALDALRPSSTRRRRSRRRCCRTCSSSTIG